MSWEYKTLDELGTVSRGRSKHRPRNDASLFGGKYPFIQTADVKEANLYLTEYTETYNDKGLEQSKLWKAGTLCITIAANIADTAILGIDACFPDSIIGFIPFEGVANVKFVKYAFDMLQKDCKQISQGTAQDNLSWKKLSTIKFPAPKIEIQNKIVDYVSAYDDLIENNQKQIKLLEEAAQHFYKEWFVDLRFPGYENVNIVGGVPVGWEIKELNEIATLKAGGDRPKVFSKNKTNYCTIPVFSNGTINDGLYGFTDEAAINEDSITISARGSVGYTCLHREPYVPIVRLISVIPIGIGVEYLYFYLKSMVFDSNGAAQQQITVPMIESKQIIIPTNDILEAFKNQVVKFFDYIDVLKKQIENSLEARNRLLPKLLSGEIEV